MINSVEDLIALGPFYVMRIQTDTHSSGHTHVKVEAIRAASIESPAQASMTITLDERGSPMIKITKQETELGERQKTETPRDSTTDPRPPWHRQRPGTVSTKEIERSMRELREPAALAVRRILTWAGSALRAFRTRHPTILNTPSTDHVKYKEERKP